tara:strand:- start:702 stop:932 length:231 start_codon:yes stop_codon:yes gene_type:complete
MINIDKIIKDILERYRGINLNYDAVIQKLTYELSTAVLEEYGKEINKQSDRTLKMLKDTFEESKFAIQASDNEEEE